jgi:hypothetical protein
MTGMTRILLARGSERQTLDFDPARQSWKRQQADFLVGLATGLPGAFAHVFVKRQKVPPPGHDLLLALWGRAVPGLPCFYGHAADGGFHYYVFESLPSAFVLADQVLYSHTALRPADLICEPFITAVVDQAAQSFAALLAESHVYTDFSTKNILVDDGWQIRLIDVDSSWPLATLQRSRHPTGVQFDATFWALWNTQVAAGSPGGEARAPQTLVLSFAAVWLRALALKAAGDANGAVALVKAAGAASQERLWTALARPDRQGFVDYFRLTDPRTPAYDAWSRIFTALRAGNPVIWSEIQAAAQALAVAIKAGVVRAPVPAPRPVVTPVPAPGPLSMPPDPAHQPISFARRLVSTLIAEALSLGVIGAVMAFMGAIVPRVPEFIFGLLPTPDDVNKAFGCFSILLLPVIVVVLLAAGLASLILGIGIFFIGCAIIMVMAACALALLANLFAEPANYRDPLAFATSRLNGAVARWAVPLLQRGTSAVRKIFNR